jgi:hypothetical protein
MCTGESDMKIKIRTLLLVCFGTIFGTASLAAEGVGTVTEASFGCIREMTPVRGFYVDNTTGDLKGTLAAANAPGGATYPPGSVVQLVPGEAMFKHAPGVSPATNDWEFFELDTSAQGTDIRKRGFADVVNRFNGNCLACHAKAAPQWDMICETGHGCDPIPLTRDIVVLLQKTDPRCSDNPPLSPEEKTRLQALQQMLQAQK